MKNIKKGIVVVAILTLCVLSIAGCGKKSAKVEINKNAIYSEQILDIPFEKGFETNTVKIGKDKIYFCGYVYNDKTYEVKNKWGFANLDGSDFKTFPLDSEDGWVDSLVALGDGNVVLFYSDYYEDSSDPDNYVWENYFYAALYGTDGKLIKKLSLSDEFGIEWINAATVLDDNSLMIVTYDKNVVLNNSLDTVKVIESDGGTEYYNFFRLKDGRMFTYYWGDEGTVYKYYDPLTNTVGEDVNFGNINLTNYTMMQGNEKYDVLLSNSLGISGYNIGDSEVTEIMNYINSDASATYFQALEAVSATEFVGCFYEWNEDENNIRVAKYTKVDPKDVKDKQTISLGCLYLDDTVRKNVIKFNKSSDDYRIVIVDYSQYETEDDWEAGMNKFNTDIVSGQGPDIIVSNSSTINDYRQKGLFLDLKPYLEKDPEIDINDLFPNLVEACSYEGKLYEIVPTFYIQTLAGKTSLLGGKTSWNFDEFNEFRKQFSSDVKILGDMDRGTLLYYFLQANSSEYVDMAKVKCYFDSPEFVKLLEFLKELPEEPDYQVYDEYDWEDNSSWYREGKAVLMATGIYNIRDFNYTQRGTFGEDITFIGYPSKEGNGSSLYYGNSYAISSKCKSPDAAWQIVRYYLTDEYQKTVSYGIPASMKRFDELGEEAKQKPFYMDGDEKVEYDDTIWINGQSIPLDPCTDADIAKLKNFILTVTNTSSDLGEVETIIDEEAAAFFEGAKSAEEVAKLIQSRASIYISEIQ